MAVNANNATLGKPALTGAIYVAPVGTTLPTDATSSLASDWKSLGYVSDSGLTNGNDPSTNAVKAWGGDEIIRYVSDMQDTFKFELVEALNVEVLKTVYGADAVTGTLATGIKIEVADRARLAYAWCIDMVLNGAVKRMVIPNAAITSMSDITYSDNDVVGYEITITAAQDASGKRHYEYILQDSEG